MSTIPVFRQIIREACERAKGDEPADFAAVLHERFPIGPGGVGHANRKLHARVLREIEDFYAPRDWSPEPDCHGYSA